MTVVPFLEVSAAYAELREELDEAIRRTCASGWYLLATELEAFEAEFAAYCGTKHCIGVANGLDALHLSLRAMGVTAGDEVIVPSHTFIATWFAVTQAGAAPVPVESDPRTYNMDPERVEVAITPRTRVILPVHLYGQPAEMTPLLQLAERHGVHVLEDAAQAHGARYRGRRVGGLGDVAAWSFYPAKNLGAIGDGGAVTTNNDALATAIRALRNYGSNRRYVHDAIGYNSRLAELQAAVLRVKLRRLDEWNDRRRRVAELYQRELAGSDLVLPHVPSYADSVWHLYVVRSPRRDQVQDWLRQAGVDTVIHYPRAPHEQGAYAHLGFAPHAFPLARELARTVLSLPLGPHLTSDQQARVLDAVRSFERAGSVSVSAGRT